MLEQKNTHSSHAKPKTKPSGQLVGIAEHIDANLEMNDSHIINNFQTCRQTFSI